MNDLLNNALRGAKTAHIDLRAALATANAVESLVILPLINDAATLAVAIERLLEAKAEPICRHCDMTPVNCNCPVFGG